MESAFGVDHGDEVSKLGFGSLGGLGGAMGGATKKVGQGMLRRSANVRRGARGMPNASATQGANAVGVGTHKMGAGITRLGGAMQRNPRTTGAIAAVGGGAGVGGATGMLANRQRRF